MNRANRKGVNNAKVSGHIEEPTALQRVVTQGPEKPDVQRLNVPIVTEEHEEPTVQTEKIPDAVSQVDHSSFQCRNQEHQDPDTHIDPIHLRVHPLNEELYGAPDADPEEWNNFLQSIRIQGVLQPIAVAADGVTILSGHRRRAAAITLGLPTVPIRVNSELATGASQLDALISSNLHRTKTPYHIGKEYKALLAIESQLARQRQGHGQTARGKPKTSHSTLPPNSTEALSANQSKAQTESRQIAARKLGVSKYRGSEASRVVDWVEKAEKLGQSEIAKALKASPTYRRAFAIARNAGLVQPPQPPNEQSLTAFDRSDLGKAFRVLQRTINKQARPHKSPDFEARPVDDVLAELYEKLKRLHQGQGGADDNIR